MKYTTLLHIERERIAAWMAKVLASESSDAHMSVSSHPLPTGPTCWKGI